MWLHKENEYEWKYIGIWFEMLPAEIQGKIKASGIQADFSQLFITYENWTSAVEMIMNSLRIRNQIYAIQFHQKMSSAEKKAALDAIETERVAKLHAVSAADQWCCYLNDEDEFRIV